MDALLDRPEPVRRAGLEEQRLDERRLPGPAVADDGDVADLARLESAARIGAFQRLGRASRESHASGSRQLATVGPGSACWRATRADQAGLQAQDRLRVQLRHARLGHAQHLADLAQRQLLVVVERDDELLALGQARDRLAERSRSSVCAIDSPAGLGRVRVLDRVDQRDRVARPPSELDHSSSSAAIEEREISSSASWNSSSVMPSFAAISSSVGARGQLRLELGDRALDLARAGAHRARHPVHRAQLVDDRALDARDRVRLELDVAVGVEALDRADQPEQAVGDEVALLDVRRQAAPQPAGHVLDERRVREDQPVAQRRGRPCACTRARAPGCRRAFSHGSEEDMGPRELSEILPDEASSPIQAAERSGGDGDHPGRAAGLSAAMKPSDRRNRAARTAKSGPEGAAVAPRYNAVATEGRSSTGRAPVSKTGGCRFESCRPCPFGGAETRLESHVYPFSGQAGYSFQQGDRLEVGSPPLCSRRDAG